MVIDRAEPTSRGPRWQGSATRSRWRRALGTRFRLLSAGRRALPGFVILGAQRAGTTSLYDWLCSHPQVTSARFREMHYFDQHYDRGRRWYRSQFPLARSGRMSGETSPYLLFHPLAPGRAGRDLPASSVFIVLLRDPVERALSHYWHERRMGTETEPLERALELEASRLEGETERVASGRTSFAHRHYSYAARGEYAPQLCRWFDTVGRDRVLVLESERLFADPATPSSVLDRLALAPMDRAFPALNAARRTDAAGAAARARLERHFERHNEALFDLLGRRLWVAAGRS